jgi:hypothetical protein
MAQMLKPIKQYITPVAIAIGVVLFTTIVLVFAFRNYALQKAIHLAAQIFNNRYQTTLIVANAQFVGLKTVALNNLLLLPNASDTLLNVNTIEISVRPWPLLFGKIRISKININNGHIAFIKRDSVANYDVFLSKHDTLNNAGFNETDFDAIPQNNYAKLVYNLINKLLKQVPDDVTIKNLAVYVADNLQYFSVLIDSFSLSQSQLQANVLVNEGNYNGKWLINGYANTATKQTDITLSTPDSGGIYLPYLKNKYNLSLGFDSVRFVLNQLTFNNNELNISGYARTRNLLLNQPKLASADVLFNEAEFDYDIKVGSNYIAIDSTSRVIFNGYTFYPFVKVKKGNEFEYWLNLKTNLTPANDFINSLPVGMFYNVKGMEASGKFAYELKFYLNEANPESMVFESNLVKENLRIIKYGKADLSKLNNDFIYIPVENGKPVRPILVSAENNNFYALDEISNYLKTAVLTNEDPSFFQHRGFVTDAFKQSIVKNIKTGKFKRGASTISMQLVKNVFLSKEKTIARKIEEILLVYMLENNHIVSKDKMFEVYLNIIEWGPNVYGIGEACKFYFNKLPSQLTLSESLFLASIVPSPKKFMWRFDNNGIARNWLERSFRFIATKMINRQFIQPEDTIGLTHLVNITGAARKFIVKNDSLLNDSLLQLQLESNNDD